MQLFQFVEKICISTDCFQAACEVAYHELSFAHKISSQNILYHKGHYKIYCITGPVLNPAGADTFFKKILAT